MLTQINYAKVSAGIVNKNKTSGIINQDIIIIIITFEIKNLNSISYGFKPVSSCINQNAKALMHISILLFKTC